MDIRTNVVIKAETKGFDKALRETLGLTQGALTGLKNQAKSYETVKQQVVSLQGKLQGLVKQQGQLNDALGKFDKSSNIYKALQASVRSVNQEMSSTVTQIRMTEQAFKDEARAADQLANAIDRVSQKKRADQEKAKGAFTQGLLQGAGAGMVAPLFLDRGPGMRRQLAGQMLGSVAGRGMGAAGSLATTPFSGLSGISQALSAVPGGSYLAGMMQNAMQHAGTGMQWTQQRLEAMPFMGGAIGRGGKLAAIQQQYNRDTLDLTGQGSLEDATGWARTSIDKAGRERGALNGLQAMLNKKQGKDKEDEYTSYLPLAGAPVPGAAKLQSEIEADDARKNLLIQTQKVLKVHQQKRDERIAQVYSEEDRPFEQTRQAGLKLMGVGRQQATQSALGLVQAGGGTVREALRGGMLPTAFAAQTAFGVDMGTSGAFLGAGRRGGLVGGRGQGAEALTSSLADAMKQGLTGSEAIKYLQTIAHGISEWEQSGIEFNKDSFKNLSMGFQEAGISAPRAGAMAGGFQSYVSGIGARGITGGQDLMLLQMMGGFRGGGGEDLEQATMALEGMKEQGIGGIKRGSGAGDYMSRMLEMGGGGATGRRFLRMQLAKMGVQASTTEIRGLAENLTGESLLNPEQRKQMEEDQARRARGAKAAEALSSPGALQSLAAGMVPGSLKKQAEIDEKQLQVGLKMVPAMQTLSETSAKMAETFGKMAGGENGSLNKFLLKIEGATESLDGFIESVDKLGIMGAIRESFGSH